jgi:hypothetical protein
MLQQREPTITYIHIVEIMFSNNYFGLLKLPNT